MKDFEADSNYQAIFNYIKSVRADSFKNNQLRKVSLAKTNEYWFYKLYFNVDGKLYEYVIAVLPQTQEVYILY